MGAGGNVVRLRGQVFGAEVTGADYMGIAVFGSRAIETLPIRGCIIADWAIPKLRKSEAIRVVFDHTDWIDIGEIGTYANANWRWLRTRNLEFWVSPGAQVHAGANLDEVIVGGGASIEVAGSFRRVIVWPGARVTSAMNNCVVVADGEAVPIRNLDI